MTKRAFQRLVKVQSDQLDSNIMRGVAKNAKEADELAADLTGQSGLDPDSEEFEALLSVLFSRAGKAFPGAWEDYPRRSHKIFT